MHSSHLNGDCSLWIRSATLEFDDGVWECQVTASDFTAQDALTSKPVRLVVRGKCVLSQNSDDAVAAGNNLNENSENNKYTISNEKYIE